MLKRNILQEKIDIINRTHLHDEPFQLEIIGKPGGTILLLAPKNKQTELWGKELTPIVNQRTIKHILETYTAIQNETKKDINNKLGRWKG